MKSEYPLKLHTVLFSFVTAVKGISCGETAWYQHRDLIWEVLQTSWDIYKIPDHRSKGCTELYATATPLLSDPHVNQIHLQALINSSQDCKHRRQPQGNIINTILPSLWRYPEPLSMQLPSLCVLLLHGKTVNFFFVVIECFYSCSMKEQGSYLNFRARPSSREVRALGGISHGSVSRPFVHPLNVEVDMKTSLLESGLFHFSPWGN